jgi:hypothetical protein
MLQKILDNLALRLPIGAHVAASVIISAFAASYTAGDVLHFDDLPDQTIISGTSYGGLIWEEGNVGLGTTPGAWAVITGDHPHSPPGNLVNTGGATLIGIGFPQPVDLGGAFFALQGNLAPADAVRAHGYLGGVEIATTSWLTPLTSTPAWLDMSVLPIVDRIVLEANPVSRNAGAYGMDDLTFTYVPEPSSLSLLALGGLLLRRRRSR